MAKQQQKNYSLQANSAITVSEKLKALTVHMDTGGVPVVIRGPFPFSWVTTTVS